jgi:hypothetical protein
VTAKETALQQIQTDLALMRVRIDQLEQRIEQKIN